MILVSDLITRAQRYINSIGNRVENEDYYDFFSTAIRDLKKGRTLPWQKKETDIDFYTDVFKNALPSDFESFIKPNSPLLSGNIDDKYYLDNIKLAGSGIAGPYLQMGREKDFYANYNVKLALAWEAENVFLLSRIDGSKDLKLEGFESDITDDTDPYVMGGDASNAVIDSVNYREGRSSLRFDIADSTNAFSITRTLTEGVDITDYINLGKVFLHFDMPTVLTSITIKYGSDASNYYEISGQTEQYYKDSFGAQWNVISFDMKDAAATGSPDDEDIKYYQISGDNTGVTDVNFRVDGLYFKLGNNYRLPYNTKNLIQSSGGTAKAKITSSNDNIIWDDNYEDILLYKALDKAGFFKFRDLDLVIENKNLYNEELIEFNRRFPSNEVNTTSQYYKKANSF